MRTQHILKHVIVITAFLILTGLPAVARAEDAAAPDAALIARGKELFHAKDALGGKFACILCHKGEKAIKKSVVEKLSDEELATVNNQQLMKKAKAAKPIDPAGEDMKALIAYIRTEHISRG